MSAVVSSDTKFTEKLLSPFWVSRFRAGADLSIVENKLQEVSELLAKLHGGRLSVRSFVGPDLLIFLAAFRPHLHERYTLYMCWDGETDPRISIPAELYDGSVNKRLVDKVDRAFSAIGREIWAKPNA